jgi:hypothetical protein
MTPISPMRGRTKRSSKKSLLTSCLKLTLRMLGEWRTQIDSLRTMRKENFAVGQRVKLKWELDPPVNIPAGAVGEVTRVSPWDVWVRFEKRVVRLPFSEVEQEGFARDRQRRRL